MESLYLKPADHVAGEVSLPGSKSISNRALILSVLAQGTTRLKNLLDADDVERMLAAMSALGLEYTLSHDKHECVVTGLGGPIVKREPVLLDLGNAGTAIRPLCAVLCLGSGDFTLTGDARMQERPIGDLVESLLQAGADISFLKNTAYPPVHIRASGLRGGEIAVKGSISSQFLSSLLMAAPLCSQDTVIHVTGDLVSKPYVDLTIKMMERFGVHVINDAYAHFTVKAGQKAGQSYTSPGELVVEGDASAASYFFAAGAIRGKLRVRGVNRDSMQGDVLFLDVIEKVGATVVHGPDYVEVSAGELRGVDLDLNHIPDAAMTLATLALFAKGKTVIRNVGNWRVKETDRLAAMAIELRKVGARVVEGDTFLEIEPPAEIQHAAIDTYKDHRMAMCFSLLALSKNSVTINDPGCVSKTFPDYFEVFARICR